MTTKPQIYATGIHASFLKTLSIYYYFLFFLLNSVAKKILRNTSAPENLFMQNKPNFRKAQINVTSFTIASYEDNRTCSRAKTKPIKANLTQFKPNSKPIQTQFRALSQRTNPLLPNRNRSPRDKCAGVFGGCWGTDKERLGGLLKLLQNE